MVSWSPHRNSQKKGGPDTFGTFMVLAHLGNIREYPIIGTVNYWQVLFYLDVVLWAKLQEVKCDINRPGACYVLHICSLIPYTRYYCREDHMNIGGGETPKLEDVSNDFLWLVMFPRLRKWFNICCKTCIVWCNQLYYVAFESYDMSLSINSSLKPNRCIPRIQRSYECSHIFRDFVFWLLYH